MGKTRHISHRTVRKHFYTTGLLLSIYILMVLYLPMFIQEMIVVRYGESFINQTPHLILFIYYPILIIGSLLPFSLIARVNGIKIKDYWRSADFNFADFFEDVAVLVSLMFMVISISTILLNRLGIPDQILMPLGLSAKYISMEDPYFIFLYIVAVPIIEEIVYNGIYLRVLSRYGNRFALYMTAGFYAIAHGSVAEMLPAFALLWLLGRLTIHYRSILPAILLHLVFNSIILGMMFLPEEFFFTFAISIVLIMIISLYMISNGHYKHVHTRHSRSLKILSELYFTTPSMFFAFLLLILQSVLAIAIRY